MMESTSSEGASSSSDATPIVAAAKTMLHGVPIAFIGAGNMAAALVEGMLAKGVARADSITAASPRGAERMAKLGVATTRDNAAAVEGAEVVVFAVKPHIMAAAASSVAGSISDGALIISVAAGTSISQIAGWLPLRGQSPSARQQPFTQRRIVRVMPNTPCAIGVGASAVCPGPGVTPADEALVRSIFSAVGTVEVVTEPQLDAVTGLSGSGPAFVCMFLEALSDGGVAAGLPRSVASALAAQMVRGAATLVQESGLHPAVLKDAVASPGGTTIAGIHALENGGFRAAVMNAVMAASKRCAELRGPT